MVVDDLRVVRGKKDFHADARAREGHREQRSHQRNNPLGGKLACGMDKPNPDATPPPKVPKRIFLLPFKTKYDSTKDADGKQKSAIEKLSPQLKREDGAVPLDSLQALLSYDLTKLDDVDSGLEFDVAHFYPTIDAQDSLEQIVAKLGQVKDKKIKVVLTADQRLATKTVKQGESYQLLFLPLACDRIVWLESGPFWNLVPRISASWTYPTAGAYYTEATEMKKCFRMKGALPQGPAAILISRIDVPGEKLLEFSEQQFLLASPTAMNYKEVYGTFSLSWTAHKEKELPKKSVEVLNPDHPYALLSLLQKCKSCSKAPDVDESAYWPKATLSEKLGQWAKGDAEYKSDRPTLKYKCISAASLPINVRAYLKAVTLAAQSERLVFPLDPHVGVLHTAHWDLLSLLPWKARDKRTAFENKVATAFKNCTEIESVVEDEIPNSKAAHVVERRNPPWGEKAEGVAHTFPASMEVALPELGYASRTVILYEAPEVTVKRESEPARTVGAPLVFISAHYQAPTGTAGSDGSNEAQPHYLVVDIVEDPILNYCCKTGYAPAAGVLDDLLWFTPDELSALKEIDKVRALCPYNWKPTPDNKQSLVECTDGYKNQGTELIKDLVDLIQATGHGREIFQDLFGPLTIDGGLSFAEPWLEMIEKEKWKFLPDCHISVRGGRGAINWKEDDLKELKNALSQRYDLHVTLRAPWKGTNLSVGRMGIPTFYLYYRLFVNKSDGNIYLFPKGLDKTTRRAAS